MHRAFKARALASKDALKKSDNRIFSQAAAKAASLLCLVVLATRKRVNEFLET